MSKESDKQKESTIPTVSEDSNTLGNIRINHSVVASIVRLAALEVSGVAAVSGGFVDGIAERLFSKKGGESGVRVEEDEVGDYRIEIHVILRFGVELAAVAKEIQQRIADQVEKMTSTSVAHVNVFIDGVRTDDEKAEPEQWGDEPHTD